ncbi:hypothetical protein B0T22DRAFT_455680 [Podospora appendiculata]|uniref:GAT domain-containing protein n=1 Tax=Podospora appendiculata TaxID=314037 RepID=A0AAE0XLW7_9PEZI|nr:hypothetical protein B0T22DRAFT_455680 [Podospora appendiculata]
MKSFSKVLGTIKKRPTFGGTDSSTPDPNGDSPEATAARYVRQFCEASGANSGDDVTCLPPIVDAAESSPAAAAECARLIRKFLHRDYWSKPSYQYNAIMLIRILSDNPGPTFTRNFDKKFVDAAKELLRSGRDQSVRQMLMETLDSFENTKGYDEGLGLIIGMWRKEKEKAYKAYGGRPQQPDPRTFNAPPFPNPADAHHQNYFSRAHSNRKLPKPIELANRLEEARTSAKLLEQVVACTPPSEVLSNDLIKEFADRCLSASRSIQGYMTADSPAPDNDTMESLIDTNEQLQSALNQHQRAMLNAKKQLGLGVERSSNPSPSPPSLHNEPNRPSGTWARASAASSSSQPSLPPPPVPSMKPAVGNGKGKATAADWDASPVAGPSRSNNGTPHHDEDDPFRDQPESSASSSRRVAAAGGSGADDTPRYVYEPYHPGFNSHGKGPAAEPVTPVSDDGLYDDENAAYRDAAATGKKGDPVYRY